MSEEITDEIVERLRNGGARCDWGADFANCPTPDDRPECDCKSDTDDEIERLREQVKHAHAILASESFGWIVCGGNHLELHINQIQPAVSSYWDKYGSYFKGSKDE